MDTTPPFAAASRPEDAAIRIARTTRGYCLEATTRLPRARAEVFAFFSDARNLERITPSTLRFRILSPLPIVMGAGARIDYRLRVHGLPMRWRTLISTWEPPARFVDEQERGPYAMWVHEHRFEAAGSDTLMHDRVDFRIAGPLLGRLATPFVVPTVRSIFRHRAAAITAAISGGSAISGASDRGAPPPIPAPAATARS